MLLFQYKLITQTLFLRHQIALEDYFISLARLNPTKDAIMVYDRGYLDNMAYMPRDAKELYIKKTGVSLENIRDSRYDMVIHMVTAANGAPEAYTLSNNKARTEGIQQAIDIDNKIKEVWNGHPNHQYVSLTQHYRQRDYLQRKSAKSLQQYQ